MQYSSIIQVPSTKGARLFNGLVKLEDSLANLTGYNVKITEKSGIQLARLFPRNKQSSKCHWEECQTCLYTETGKQSKCRVGNVVYEAVCLECIDEEKNGNRQKEDVGRYIGESSRTLAERSAEHVKLADNIDHDSFIVKHWVTNHTSLMKAPRMRFRVLRSFQDPLSRMATESIFIETMANMNSRNEFRNNKISRLVVVDPRKKNDGSTGTQEEELLDEDIKRRIEALRQTTVRPLHPSVTEEEDLKRRGVYRKKP